MSQEVTVESDNYHESTWQMGKYSATGYATCTYNSTLSITVPTTQKGKWEPYMYASTEEAVNSNGIGAKTLNTLTGAIAIRAFEVDGTTSKQLKSITIEATAPIAGAFSGTAQSVGRTPSVTGPQSDGNKSNVLQKDEMISDARGKLTTALQGYTATSTTVTKAMSLSFAGSDNKVTAENLETIAKDADGCYTYHLNVAPFEGADLKITVISADDSRYVKTIPAQSLAAEHRKGYVFVWENAAFGYEYIDTWYDNCTNTSFAGNTIYISNVKVTGSVDAANVQSIGARIYNEDGTLYKKITESETLSFSYNAAEVPSGKYTVEVFADVNVNGEVVTKSDSKNVTVTAVAALNTDDSYIRSSYSYNGDKKTDNTLGGGDLRVKASLNDAYITNNLVQSYTFYYTHNGTTTTVNPTLGKEWGTSFDHNNWGQYDCYVKIVLGNGYVVECQPLATHITGIPYTLNTSSNDGSWEENGYVNWNTDGGVRLGKNQWGGEAYIQRSFHIPANVTVKVTANGVVNGTGTTSLTKVENIATLIVGSTTVINDSQKGNTEKNFSCNAASASMSSSNNTVKCNSSYNTAAAKVVLKALTIQY